MLAVGVLLAAIALTLLATTVRGPLPGDLLVLGLVQHIRSGVLDWLMVQLTLWGGGFRFPLLILLAILGLVIVRRVLGALFLGLTTGSSILLEQALKLLVDRPRPHLAPVWMVLGLSYPTDASFPSGHALHTTVFYGTLAFLWFRFSHGRRRWLGMPIAAIVVLLTGISRIYLGVHWPSDVLGGYLYGAFWLWLSIAGYLRLASPRG